MAQYSDSKRRRIVPKFIPTYNPPDLNAEGLTPYWYEAVLMIMSDHGHLISKTRMGSLYAANPADALTVLHALAKDNWEGELRHATILEVNADGETKEVVARTQTPFGGGTQNTDSDHTVPAKLGVRSVKEIAVIHRGDRKISPLMFGTRWGAAREFPTLKLEEFINDDESCV